MSSRALALPSRNCANGMDFTLCIIPDELSAKDMLEACVMLILINNPSLRFDRSFARECIDPITRVLPFRGRMF